MFATSLRIVASSGPSAFTPGSEMEVMGPSMMILVERQARDRVYLPYWFVYCLRM
jgi:hypothetical protein